MVNLLNIIKNSCWVVRCDKSVKCHTCVTPVSHLSKPHYHWVRGHFDSKMSQCHTCDEKKKNIRKNFTFLKKGVTSVTFVTPGSYMIDYQHIKIILGVTLGVTLV